MTGLLPALFGALVIGGLLGAAAALRPSTPRPRTGRAPSALGTRLGALARVSPRVRTTAAVSVLAGAVLALVTGWVAAVVILPAAAVGLPYLLSAPPAAQKIRRVEAMEEWTRSLAGVLGAGVGLEQALTATLRSTPEPIKPEVTALVARLRARWDTETALRAFADDLDDATGDLIAASLILGARRRGPGLARVLVAIADAVAEEVAMRRKVEAERAKPRATARAVTLITLGVVAVGALNGTYLAPYGTPLGQLVLAMITLGFVGALGWMRALTL
ncbi:type II secretion system F family protein, partial [Lapillicoccus sp.]|uniref:type II secretion system F family protein n=1 Tax=Lapillicoccus sp. TaxID=1909287 RepID=UPI0025E9C89E